MPEKNDQINDHNYLNNVKKIVKPVRVTCQDTKRFSHH